LSFSACEESQLPNRADRDPLAALRVTRRTFRST
jgi:hypothetical protein